MKISQISEILNVVVFYLAERVQMSYKREMHQKQNNSEYNKREVSFVRTTQIAARKIWYCKYSPKKVTFTESGQNGNENLTAKCYKDQIIVQSCKFSE